MLFALLALASCASANVFTTNPTGSTTFTGGQPATINWNDDNTAPSLQQFGPSMISIYVGNSQQQTSLQRINASVDVSTVNSISFTPDPTIGPDAPVYFIRYESLALKDATQPQFPALAFSHMFTMAGMTGTFSPAVQAQIASSIPVGSATGVPTSATGATNTASATITQSKSANATKPTSSGSTTPTTSKKPGSASVLIPKGFSLALVGFAVAQLL